MTWNPDVLANRILSKMISWVAVVSLSFASSESNFTFAINARRSLFSDIEWIVRYYSDKLDVECEVIFYASQKENQLLAKQVKWHFPSLHILSFANYALEQFVFLEPFIRIQLNRMDPSPTASRISQFLWFHDYVKILE